MDNPRQTQIQPEPPQRAPEPTGGGMPRWLIYLLGIVGVVYLLNPTAGIFELLPDNLPIVGNLDDGVAAVLAWSGISEFLKQWKARRA